jgi:hypothetical protein
VHINNPIVLWHTHIEREIGEQWGYATEIMNERYTIQKPDNTRRSLFLGGFRTYPSKLGFNLSLIFSDVMHLLHSIENG